MLVEGVFDLSEVISIIIFNIFGSKSWITLMRHFQIMRQEGNESYLGQP